MDLLLSLIYQMREGKIPTSRFSECPHCSEVVSISAGESSRHTNLDFIQFKK